MFLCLFIISCASSWSLISIATDTTISIPVAVNELRRPCEPTAIAENNTEGTRAKNARNIAPKSVILFDTFLRYSVVGFPGRMPGTKPPCC